MVPRFRFARLLWFVLLICAFLAFGPGYAEAEEGLASWYGPEEKPPASGVPYDPNDYTAASRTLPLGTKLLVSYGESTVSVTVNDRKPIEAGHNLDLSPGAAQALGLTKVGVGEVDRGLANPNLPQGVASREVGIPHGLALQQPDLAPGSAEALGFTKVSVSDVEDWRFGDPNPSQGVAQQPQSWQEMPQQPNLARGIAQQPDLAQGAPPRPLGLTKVSVGEVEDWSFTNPNLLERATSQGLGTPQGTAQRPDLSQGVTQQPQLSQGVVRQVDSSQGAMQDVTGRGDYLVQPGDTLSSIASRLGTSVDHLARSNGIADPNLIRSGQALYLQPNGIDSNFIGGPDDFIRSQEGFRLDGYVPDLGFSRSGVTIGTGVDIGQMSVADIEALDIPNELKQKFQPYAGLIQQDAAYFLSTRPLHLTEYEANALDRVVAQNTVEGVAHRFNTAAPGNSFVELPPEVRTAIADLAYQYGPNLAQRMPNVWSDVTEGRWNSVIQKLRNFGDRYPTRRNIEADLLQRAIERGAFRHYLVQPGDTLPEIASRLGTSVDHLARSNGIADPNVVYSGQALHY